MTCHCTTSGVLGEMFTERAVEREAARFRKRGLSNRATRLLEAIFSTGPVAGETVLEVGAGVAGLSIELLRRGARRAVAVDALAHAARTARTLAEEYGVASRFESVHADFTEFASDDVHTIVVLDRVVCCFPDWQALLSNAAHSAERVVALTYPRSVWWGRSGIGILNVGLRLLGRHFRMHLHPPVAMLAYLRERGFETRIVGNEGIWQIVVAIRTTAKTTAPNLLA